MNSKELKNSPGGTAPVLQGLYVRLGLGCWKKAVLLTLSSATTGSLQTVRLPPAPFFPHVRLHVLKTKTKPIGLHWTWGLQGEECREGWGECPLLGRAGDWVSKTAVPSPLPRSKWVFNPCSMGAAPLQREGCSFPWRWSLKPPLYLMCHFFLFILWCVCAVFKLLHGETFLFYCFLTEMSPDVGLSTSLKVLFLLKRKALYSTNQKLEFHVFISLIIFSFSSQNWWICGSRWRSSHTQNKFLYAVWGHSSTHHRSYQYRTC